MGGSREPLESIDGAGTVCFYNGHCCGHCAGTVRALYGHCILVAFAAAALALGHGSADRSPKRAKYADAPPRSTVRALLYASTFRAGASTGPRQCRARRDGASYADASPRGPRGRALERSAARHCGVTASGTEHFDETSLYYPNTMLVKTIVGKTVQFLR